MRYLGIDYGSTRIGLAFSDEGAQFAFPLGIVPNEEDAVESIVRIVSEKKITSLVVGDTRAEGGASNRITEECEKFANTLATTTNLPLHFTREAWSSFEASRYAPEGRERDDAASAAIILQRFLDSLPKKE